MKIDFNAFMTFCKSLEGQMFLAVNDKTKFILMAVKAKSLELYVPTSSSHLTAREKQIQPMLDLYEETGSLELGPYVDLDYAPYTLILLNLYINHEERNIIHKTKRK